MSVSFLILPELAIDQILFNLDCKSIRSASCVCRDLYHYIRTRIKCIFQNIYFDESIRLYLHVVKAKMHNYNDFLKISRIVDDDFTREYYYYKGIAKETKNKKNRGGRNHCIIPENEITDRFHGYIETYMRYAIMGEQYNNNNLICYKKPPVRSLNRKDREYRCTLFNLKNQLKSLVSNTLSAYHDLTLIEYLLMIRNFLNQVMNYSSKRNTMIDTKNVINAYREMLLSVEIPENHIGYFYFYLLLRYHDINRTMLSDYGASHRNQLDKEVTQAYLNFTNVVRPDYFEQLFNYTFTNVERKNYINECNLMVKLFKNVYDKAHLQLKNNIIYFKRPYEYNYGYYSRFNFDIGNCTEYLYINIDQTERFITIILRELEKSKKKNYLSLMKLINNGFVITNYQKIGACNRTIDMFIRDNLISKQQINYIINICKMNISSTVALEMMYTHDFNYGLFKEAYEIMEYNYNYNMKEIILFLSKNNFKLPRNLSDEIGKFNRKDKFYYPLRHQYGYG